MQIDEVRIGKTYLVKIGGNHVEATITRKHEQGGWEATTVRTGKTIRIASAERLCLLGDSEARSETITIQTPKYTTSTERRNAGQRDASDGKPMTLLNAAAHLLANSNGEQMSCATIVNLVVSQGFWKKGKGKTPANTLHAAIAREIRVKGEAARFKKTERGKFAFNAAS